MVPPRMRGWSFDHVTLGDDFMGSPAYAGMVLARGNTDQYGARFPRVCGDGPNPEELLLLGKLLQLAS